MKDRYQVKLGDRRTTKNMDTILSNLMAIKLSKPQKPLKSTRLLDLQRMDIVNYQLSWLTGCVKKDVKELILD